MGPSHPTRFGKYLLLDKIAAGGMAELYRAKITGIQGFEKLIAIKKILPHLSEEEELVKAFIDEAKLAALLHHQHIVQIYDFGTIDGSYFIAMEYLLGKDLGIITRKFRSEEQPLSLEYALFVTSRICNGLDYAHRLKDFQGKPLSIIHRDISPQNILVTYEGDVKIVDFGIAKAATQSSKTQMGMIKGKVAYMSPEQAEGKAIDYRSDIFSTGIILYELVTGRRMFTGDTMKILSLVREAEFEAPERIRKDLPPKLYEILNLALTKDPEQRYQSAGDMLTDLEECTHQLDARPSARGLSQYMKGLFEDEIAAEKSGLWEAGEREAAEETVIDGEVATVGEELPAVEPQEPPRRRKQQRILYGALAAGIVIAGVLFASLFNQEPGAPPEKKTLQSSTQEPGSPAEKEIPKSAVQTAEPKPHEEMASIAASEPSEGKAAISPSMPPPAESPPSEIDDSASQKLDMGIEALRTERFAEAITLFEEALTLEPSMMGEVSGLYAQALQGEAVRTMAEDPEHAQALLSRAVGLDPENMQAYFQLGVANVKLKKFPEAIESYQKVVKLDSEFPDAFFNLGYVFAITKDYSRAEAMYSRVVELEPSYLDEALFNLAMVQLKQEKRDQCLENLKKALAVNPENKHIRDYLQKLTEGQ